MMNSDYQKMLVESGAKPASVMSESKTEGSAVALKSSTALSLFGGMTGGMSGFSQETVIKRKFNFGMKEVWRVLHFSPVFFACSANVRIR